jgi:hypothetical protein
MQRRAGIEVSSRPWLRMTVPGGDFNLNSVELGKPIGRSWVLFCGLIPVDYDEIKLDEIEPGRGFVERSRMLSQRSWEHVRTIRPVDGGSQVTDAVAWEPRLPLPGAAMRPMFKGIFGHRHRRLRRRFGGIPVD